MTAAAVDTRLVKVHDGVIAKIVELAVEVALFAWQANRSGMRAIIHNLDRPRGTSARRQRMQATKRERKVRVIARQGAMTAIGRWIVIVGTQRTKPAIRPGTSLSARVWKVMQCGMQCHIVQTCTGEVVDAAVHDRPYNCRAAGWAVGAAAVHARLVAILESVGARWA
jgi:hypothetical protein